MVKGDIRGNISKVRDRFLKAPLQSETLQDLVNNELAAKEKKASEGLFWLVRYVVTLIRLARDDMLINASEDSSSPVTASSTQSKTQTRNFPSPLQKCTRPP
jgi:Glycolipid transfer protein (GLTP)